jgi:hypothetical protein
MNAWSDWAKIAVAVVSLGLPAVALADGFESGRSGASRLAEVFVTDEVEEGPPAEAVDPVDHEVELHESVLVEPPLPVDAALPADSTLPCDACGSIGCTSCCDAGGCTGSGRRSGWHAASGYFNRVLGDASPRWVAQVDALMLWQGNIASRPLYVSTATGLPALDINQAQTPMTAGPRFGLLLNLDPCYSIEGNYFNVQSFNGEQSPAVTAAGYSMNNLAGFSFGSIDWAQVTTTGQIQSAELNWRRRPCGSPLTWLAGFRWVEWNQSMRLFDFYSGSVPGSEQFDAVTGNDLYGGQIGADLLLLENANWVATRGGLPFAVNGVAKAGIFYNSSLRLTNWLALRAGYSVFWLSGVAVPADQLSTTNLVPTPATATINTNGSVLLHGVTTGLEARW